MAVITEWDQASGIPYFVLGHLPGRQEFLAAYPTRRAALDALSVACLAFARRHAG